MRGRFAAVAAVALLTALSQPQRSAAAPTPASLAAASVRAWTRLETAPGAFRDPSVPPEQQPRGEIEYGGAMLGAGMLRAGVRDGDGQLIADGLRAVTVATVTPPTERGVFDGLAMADAYDYARIALAQDPGFQRVAPRWVRYLQQLGPPKLGTADRDCILAAGCFHNHEAVEAAEDAELLATGLSSPLRGTKLHNRAALRAAVLRAVGRTEPRFARGDGVTFGPARRSGLALLSDSGSFALGYDALSTFMLAYAVDRIGRPAPPAAVAALRRTTDSLAAFMGPDGDVGYIGRRQEVSWAAGGAAGAGAIAATLLPRRAPQDVALAVRAVSRLASAYGVDGDGLRVVPRHGPGETDGRGIDSDWLAFAGLTVFELDAADDALVRLRATAPAALTADRSGGAFVERAQLGFAAVRHGDVWFAVHRRAFNGDLRYDFGLVAAKWRRPDGAWVDILRPRPDVYNRELSAGPVILRSGRRWLPYGDTIRLGRGGTIVVDGGFRDLAGRRLRGASFRYTPLARGVRITFDGRRGDTILMTTYAPRGQTFHRRGSVFDGSAVATTSPLPARISTRAGLSSCCDIQMVAAEAVLRVRRDETVAYTLRAR